jgi:DNA-binding winged helix-turn-helix (wHTH) protein
MFLLCVLAANAGTVVSRNELMTALWPKVFVNENSLTRAVSELRKALTAPVNASEMGAAMGTALIDTIPKKGYRLNAQVTLAAAASGISVPAAIASTARHYRHSLHFAVAASLAVISALLSWQFPTVFHTQPEFVASSSTASPTMPATDRIGTASAGIDVNQVVQPAQSVLSHNGDLVAYVSYNDAGSSLILDSLTSFSSPVNIYATEELIFNLQWSPVDNILMFAQTPRLSPAALSLDQETVRLVMFDISTMSATVLRGARSGPVLREPFNLT